MSTKTAARQQAATPLAAVMPLIAPFVPPILRGDAYLQSLGKSDHDLVPAMEQLNHDLLMLLQKRMEIAAIYMNIWTHSMAAVFPWPANAETE